MFRSYSAHEPDLLLWQSDRTGNTNYRETFHSLHFSCSNYIFNIRTKCTYTIEYTVLLSTLSYIFTQRILPSSVLRWTRYCFSIIVNIAVNPRTIHLKICNQTMWQYFWASDRVLPEDGAVSTEICRRMFKIIHDFYCVCAFCWYIKDTITIEDAKLL